MMQVGMIVGYFTAWPVNRWLVQTRIKEKMDHRKHFAMLVEQMRRDQGDTVRGERPHARVRTSARAEERRLSREHMAAAAGAGERRSPRSQREREER
jgi:hypothetical protein